MMPETAGELRNARNAIGLTQLEVAQLLDVHPLTVSKWERGILTPSTWQRSLLESFVRAERNRPGIMKEAMSRIQLAGIGQGLLVALYAAHPTAVGAAPQTDCFGPDSWPEGRENP